jgi:protease-4
VLRPDRALDPAVADVVQQSIDHGYEEFLARVSAARKMTRDQVDKIARGRVWSGEDAKAMGLVDQLGGLDQAIESAAKRAKLAKGYRVYYVEQEKTARERILEMLTARTSAWARAAGWLDDASAAALDTGTGGEPGGSRPALALARQLRDLQADLERLARWNDPRGLYAHCLCGEE